MTTKIYPVMIINDEQIDLETFFIKSNYPDDDEILAQEMYFITEIYAYVLERIIEMEFEEQKEKL